MAAYAWDMVGGGFPYEALHAEMRGMGVAVPQPPSIEASRIDAMADLWTGAGLEEVQTRELVVQRTFADFDDYWPRPFSAGRASVRSASSDDAGEEAAATQSTGWARPCRQDAAGRHHLQCPGERGEGSGIRKRMSRAEASSQ